MLVAASTTLSVLDFILIFFLVLLALIVAGWAGRRLP